jgi:hypothetical protein
LWHVQFALTLSSLVQTKNSLAGFLEYEEKHSQTFDTQSVCTPIPAYQPQKDPKLARDNLHVLLITDDMNHLEY